MQQQRPTDEGFTLIEVVIAMFLLALIALMLVPALIAANKASGRNATLATASQLAAQQIDEARGRAATCAALQAYQAETIASVVDARGVSLQAKRNPITCPSTYPNVATVSVAVTLTGGTTVLASVTTYILLGSAS